MEDRHRDYYKLRTFAHVPRANSRVTSDLELLTIAHFLTWDEAWQCSTYLKRHYSRATWVLKPLGAP